MLLSAIELLPKQWTGTSCQKTRSKCSACSKLTSCQKNTLNKEFLSNYGFLQPPLLKVDKTLDN
jgi:hypothetical protein